MVLPLVYVRGRQGERSRVAFWLWSCRAVLPVVRAPKRERDNESRFGCDDGVVRFYLLVCWVVIPYCSKE